ncbi:ABC transporter substrate-binding protein [Isoptericola cucumis]|uniref:ABC transporter substrate-binding protein n=1 Tax=Isoptericola cucumis TaxID=1776856 RepID=A0ABQ2B6G9_9MICO|nr:ABC transporter substrate-binding protein [Isoptericola cucumis]GGI09218.1 ABC transporter substrate-binding protein [Isoptericola cucumis]
MSHTPARRARTAAAALAAVAALGLTACAGPSVGATSDDASADAEAVDWSQVEPATEITWWSNHPGQSQDLEKQYIEEFEAETGISVDLVTAGADYDEVAQRFQAASQTDELPDLVIASDVWWFRYHLNDQIMPVDDVMEHLDADAADFQPALYADYEYDDQHWAVPYARSTPLFYYNKDLWKAAGLPDRGPKTWAELEKWDRSLKKETPKDGSTFGLSTGPSWGAWWFENMIWGTGGAYSDGFDLTLDTPEALAGGEFVHDLFHTSGVATLSADDNMADFSSGVIASTIGSTGSLKGALDAASFEVGTAYLPDGPQGGGTPTGGTGLAIPSSKTPEEQLAAAMFLEFLTNTENTAEFSQATGYMPVRTSAVESDAMQRTYAETPQFRTAVDQLADKARVQDDVRVFVPGADALLNEALEQIVIEGTDPKAAFESITPRIETAYSENVEPYL